MLRFVLVFTATTYDITTGIILRQNSVYDVDVCRLRLCLIKRGDVMRCCFFVFGVNEACERLQYFWQLQ